MAYLIYYFIECLPKEIIIIILASGITWYLKMETFVSYLDFTFVTENRCKVVVFFFNHHLKSALLKHGCNKISIETCI